jgi:hypothetical protein
MKELNKIFNNLISNALSVQTKEKTKVNAGYEMQLTQNTMYAETTQFPSGVIKYCIERLKD